MHRQTRRSCIIQGPDWKRGPRIGPCSWLGGTGVKRHPRTENAKVNKRTFSQLRLSHSWERGTVGTQSGQGGTLAALGDGIAAAARKAGDIQRAIPLAGGNAEMPPFCIQMKKKTMLPTQRLPPKIKARGRHQSDNAPNSKLVPMAIQLINME